MPELPEVETTVRLLVGDLVGRSVRGVEVGWERSLGGLGPEDMARALVGARFEGLRRRGKYVIGDLSRRGRPAGALLVHLRMSGRLIAGDLDADLEPYVRISLRLDRGRLAFVDVRKFGRFTWCEDADGALAHLGPEPLGPTFTRPWFRNALAGRKRALKPLLLDQEFLAGLGNIYVDESLHASGLHPLRLAGTVPGEGADTLHGAIRRTLREAIRREGSSFDRFYRTPKGQPGSYQEQFRVYGRGGKPCRTCGEPVVRIVVGQRGTHLCPACQPE